jgi:hypothetical protein
MGKKFFAAPEAELLAVATDQVRAAYALMKKPPLYELYDLKADPFEFNNLADTPAHAATQARLVAALKQWQIDTGDPLQSRAMARRLFHLIRDAGTAQRRPLDYKSFMKLK